jgi:hypothetical protein
VLSGGQVHGQKEISEECLTHSRLSAEIFNERKKEKSERRISLSPGFPQKLWKLRDQATV